MITTGGFNGLQTSTYSVDLNIHTPESGFEFAMMETGVLGGTFRTNNMMTVSGVSGYLFDQSGKFFGGYESGVPFNIQFKWGGGDSSEGYSYYHNDVLMANGMLITGAPVTEIGEVNFALFHKHGDSTAFVEISGIESIMTDAV
mgnify:CR=1 FL=1|tara:strand:+ start:1418 stop:1849 length:432 start_codon:yes stop_codon:yes gene_type:complete